MLTAISCCAPAQRAFYVMARAADGLRGDRRGGSHVPDGSGAIARFKLPACADGAQCT
jgi:hypothetical protein